MEYSKGGPPGKMRKFRKFLLFKMGVFGKIFGGKVAKFCKKSLNAGVFAKNGKIWSKFGVFWAKKRRSFCCRVHGNQHM